MKNNKVTKNLPVFYFRSHARSNVWFMPFSSLIPAVDIIFFMFWNFTIASFIFVLFSYCFRTSVFGTKLSFFCSNINFDTLFSFFSISFFRFGEKLLPFWASIVGFSFSNDDYLMHSEIYLRISVFLFGVNTDDVNGGLFNWFKMASIDESFWEDCSDKILTSSDVNSVFYFSYLEKRLFLILGIVSFLCL